MKTHAIRLLILCLGVCSSSLHAQKYYHQWPFSIAEGIEKGFGASVIDFNNGKVQIWGPDSSFAYAVGQNSGFVCKENGHLLLSSNGCAVLNDNFMPIPGLDTLTIGSIFENICPAGYGGFHRTLVVPDLKDPSTSMLLYHRGEYDPEHLLSSNYLFSSTFSYKSDSLRIVSKRDTLRFEDSYYNSLSMIPHQSKPSWWVLELSGKGTNGWLSYLINKDTVEYFPEQFIGPNITVWNFDLGQITFSPDGTKIALLHHEEGIFIFDFDRATGQLSNERNYKADWMWRTDSTNLDGTCFSPNSEILYVSNSRAIYQLIEGRTAPFVQVVDITVEPGAYSSFPVFVGEMQLGPDCRMYVSPGAISGHMSVIHHPNLIGPACGFEYKAILMPNMIYHQAPATTYYHLGTGTALCDSSIQWLSTSTFDPTTPEPGFDIFPNPTHSSFQVQLDSDQAILDLTITDLTGRIVRNAPSLSSDAEIDITPLGTGIYFVHVRYQGDYLGVRKLVVAR